MLKLKKQTNLSSIKEKISTKITEQKKISKLKSIINAFNEKWESLMAVTGKYNAKYQTFTLKDTKKETYGFSAKVYCPIGLSFDILSDMVSTIEDNFNCLFVFNKERLGKYAEVKFVQNLSTEKKFRPIQTKPWQLYVGDTFDGIPKIINLNTWCHFLVTGTTGGGKSKLLDIILTTQIYNHTKEDLELYLIQLDKVDLLIYEDAKICNGFANNLGKSMYLINYLLKENKRRDSLVAKVKKSGLGSNITDYNKEFPNDKQKTILLVIDELASLSEVPSDTKIVKDMKNYVRDGLIRLSQLSRSNNIFLILSTQRPTKEFISPFVKAMCSTKISFRQNNARSSDVALDDSKIALGLMNRVAVVSQSEFNFIQTPFISDPLILKFIKGKLQKNHFTIFHKPEYAEFLASIDTKSSKKKKKKDLEEGKQDLKYEKMIDSKIKELKSHEKMINDMLKLLKSKDEIKHVFDKVGKKQYDLQTNIPKIPDFVEYKPIDKEKVIDKTIINPSDCQKPIKGKVKLK